MKRYVSFLLSLLIPSITSPKLPARRGFEADREAFMRDAHAIRGDFERARHWDEETNDGKGWCVTEFGCPYCGRNHAAVHPADVDSRTLFCPYCGLREQEPPAPN